MNTLFDFITEQPKNKICVVTFNTKGDKAIRKTISAVLVTGTTNGYFSLCGEPEHEYADLWIVIDNLGWNVTRVYNARETSSEIIEKAKECVLTYWATKELAINSFNDMAKNESFFKITDLEFASHIAPEHVDSYHMSRGRYLAAMEAKRAREEAERKAKKEAEHNRRLSEYNNKLDAAEQDILNKRDFKNDDIFAPNGDEKSLVLELMRRHKINIPLKTAGWIVKALHEVKFTERGNISYTYRGGKNGSKNSTVFIEYLVELQNLIITADLMRKREGVE